ncbi:putative bifunctional diguanylate cyclase/phosphodiesterase [Antrihabitans stalactiti]|uniref:Bifunctional diguanylate cyclase/phosphodiesterase n=1 Tax=Antrihabitans stalactiti TaxID=2584121 RepID=A0A848KGX6_9NOCA|nr:bifunctional diguanylate cyclase/phosphodiesterase [Antrihabitans stalactiti]NMN97421.1 bifunctional diguanylate cyclase/phosphodiesterase [Antrihabitans stalactiti]
MPSSRIEWLLRPAALATPAVMARTTGTLATFGSLIGFVITGLAPAKATTPLSYATAGLAAILAVVLLTFGCRFTRRHYEALTWFGIAVMTVGTYAQTTSIGTVAVATNYVLFSALAGFFFSLTVASLQIGACVAGCLVLPAIRPELSWWAGLSAASVVILVGTTVFVLSRLASAAEADSLTGLVNRRGFDRRLDIEIERAERDDKTLLLVLIDIDRFQEINERQGHAGGDEALRHIAKTGRRLVRPEHLFARYGGDEFAILMPNSDDDEAIRMSELLRMSIRIGCSAGVTRWQPGESASSLVSRADIALYRAKRAGRNRTKIESGAWPPFAAELRDAIDDDTINVHYQPIVELASGNIVGVEALLRWAPATRPDLRPDEIVRIAEDNDLIAALDQSVLRRACLDALEMQRSVITRLDLNVNVSGLEINEKNYADMVDDTLRATGWPSDQLILEVTETFLAADTETAIANIRTLRERGIRIAIDDFGSGYSSLNRLAELPTDLLKLDANFVFSITPTSGPPRLLAAVAALGVALELPVIAEGVETASQDAAVKSIGFRFAQGYFYGRPEPAGAFIAAAAASTRR